MTAFLYLFTFLGVGALHMGFSSTAPYPLNAINVSLLLIALMVISTRYRLALFTTMLMGVLMELYAITPFGLVLSSMVISVSGGMIIATTLLSTLQLSGGVLLIASMTALFRASFALMLWIASAWTTTALPSARVVFRHSITEIVATSIAGALIVFLYALWSRKTRHARLSLDLSDI